MANSTATAAPAALEGAWSAELLFAVSSRRATLYIDTTSSSALLTTPAAPNIFAGDKVAKAPPSSIGAVPPVAAPVEPAADLPGVLGTDEEPPEPSPVRHDADGNIIPDEARDEAHPIPAEPGAVETPEAAADEPVAAAAV